MLAVLIGHDEISQGASGKFPDGLMSEYQFHNEVVAPIILSEAKYYTFETKIFHRNFGGIAKAYENINDWARGHNACCIELHFNAFDRSTSGTEVLFDLDPPESKDLANDLQEQLCQALHRPGLSRGIKLTQEGRGSFNLKMSKIATVISEAFFGDNVDDARLAYQMRYEYARAILKSTNKFFDRKK